jgi:antitoxin CptB
MTSSNTYLKKKLLYQSKNRGCKETDLILGQFADCFLSQMTSTELESYTVILQQTDADIVDWITRNTEVPQELQSSVMQKLLNFNITSK